MKRGVLMTSTSTQEIRGLVEAVLDGFHPSLVLPVTPQERDQVLGEKMGFPDGAIPTGELASWAYALSILDKEICVRAALAAARAVREFAGAGDPHVDWMDKVIEIISRWVVSERGTSDLRVVGEAWWSLVRNTHADTKAADTVLHAWFVTGYDPEGWGNPPEDENELEGWLHDAADNRFAIIDVLGAAQDAVGQDQQQWLLDRIIEELRDWREGNDPVARRLGLPVQMNLI